MYGSAPPRCNGHVSNGNGKNHMSSEHLSAHKRPATLGPNCVRLDDFAFEMVICEMTRLWVERFVAVTAAGRGIDAHTNAPRNPDA
jgi:hypothetical protein